MVYFIKEVKPLLTFNDALVNRSYQKLWYFQLTVFN